MYLPMTEAELIKVQSTLRADQQNGRVVARILMADSAKCTCCGYRDNSDAFDRLLWRYSLARIDESKWKQRYSDTRIDSAYFANRGNLTALYLKASLKALHLKDQLDKLQPCFRCRLKYNPTGKTKFLGKVLKARPWDVSVNEREKVDD